jgi:hypothetical protein
MKDLGIALLTVDADICSLQSPLVPPNGDNLLFTCETYENRYDG